MFTPHLLDRLFKEVCKVDPRVYSMEYHDVPLDNCVIFILRDRIGQILYKYQTLYTGGVIDIRQIVNCIQAESTKELKPGAR
jgi:hypothetical protein